jgi:hypothetical protein
VRTCHHHRSLLPSGGLTPFLFGPSIRGVNRQNIPRSGNQM